MSVGVGCHYSSRPPAKNARLLTFFSFFFYKITTELFYALQIEKNISFALKSLHHWLKRNIAFHHWLKKTLLKSILKHVKTKTYHNYRNPSCQL
jgi:hypothetical protein